MNKFRVNLHSALFDIETGGDTADVKEKQSEQGNTSVEYKPQGVSSTIQEAEKNSKAQDEKDLKKLEQALGIKDTSEIGLNDIETIKNFDYGKIFNIKNFDKFEFNDLVEQTDEKGKYIIIEGKKMYNSQSSDGKDGIYYEANEKEFIITGIKDGETNYAVIIEFSQVRSPNGRSRERTDLKVENGEGKDAKIPSGIPYKWRETGDIYYAN